MELRIPPPIVVLTFVAAMWLATRYVPALTLFSLPFWIALIPVAAGLYFTMAGVTAFKSVGTTSNPTTPDASSTIVTTGVYSRSRNPMYVGLALMLAGWALYLGNLGAVLLLPGFVLYMNRYQIKPEESALQQKFGSEYTNYLHRVRRWL